MKARIKLKLGNMFDGPSDLIILPCSTSGTITRFVEQHLADFEIQYPKSGMKLGQVDIMPFTGGENIAQFVAYAASVEHHSSTTKAIEQIGVHIGNFTMSNSSIRAISAPLLGAGAGGLPSESVVVSLRRGFLITASPEATLIINVLHKNVFNRLKNNLLHILKDELSIKNSNKSEPLINKPPLRVFISYTVSHTQEKEWVKDLASYLRKNGVDARLDAWHLRRGMDLPQWMCNELQLADKVLIISNERYVQKADGRHGGVGWETMVIQGDMAQLPPDSTKYITIVRSDNFEKGIPFYLKTKYSIHWPSTTHETQYKEELLKELFEIDKAPPIGNEPVFI